ncbi:acyl-CoA dehydrogenase family protein [Gordonia sp. VNK1]|uniref:acyl-CoA dehydrogenase family protein n=1 Tax=Gordonia oleivorans TaxID=3156618 RepID=UPI0032B5D2C7
MTAPGTVDAALAEMMSAVFADHAQRRGATADVGWDSALWRRLDELGLARLTGSDDSGGSGAGWAEAAELLRSAARHAVSVPLVEHDLLAGWVLETAGLDVGAHRRTACVVDACGVAHGVGWAGEAQRIVVIWQSADGLRAADIPTESARITPGRNVAGEPRDTVQVDLGTLSGAVVDDGLLQTFRLRGALARSVQICAATERILELSIDHVSTRSQFGRPLARFQAVAHLVADIAIQVSAARAATEAALRVAADDAWTDPRSEFLVAVSRSCVSQAVSVVVRNAHQVHGAIGTTAEHPLHRYSLPAMAWRSEFGSPRFWDRVVTDHALRAGRAGLWPLITG